MKSLLNVPTDITNAEFVDPYPWIHQNIVVGVWSELGDGAGAIEFEIAVMLFAVSYVTAAAVHTLSWLPMELSPNQFGWLVDAG